MNTFTSLKNNGACVATAHTFNTSDFEFYFYPAPKPTVRNILFAHANGIPALTYKSFLQDISLQLNINIIAYDMRGIGKTRAKESTMTTWENLTEGHSLGAWISLLSAQRLNVKDVWLFDPPILLPKMAFKWALAVLLGKRQLNPNSQKVRKRRLSFASFNEAFDVLKSKPFMQRWDKETIENYIEGSFFQREHDIYLRHDPMWEAHLFEQYFLGAWVGFLSVSPSYRKKMKPLFFVGAQSDTCNPRAKSWVKLFFKNLEWHLIEEGGHMFVFEKTKQTLKAIKSALV
jgi:pimeloyl-ACP methyl ester carboxylesterase